ncbi:g2024 [Coccomyxa viridis]|uniref:Chlorophyll a-b binding protein, chloroplastic n=1 Tax=Coccomyxa viridis TaxID=1274662 RepID=A0ABP1FJD7_9CHLO
MSQTTFTALNGAPTFLAGRKVVSKARAAPSKRASFQVSAALQQGRRLWAPGVEAPEYLNGDLAGDYGWDPLGLGANPERLNWYRQAELQNGRWAMLGVAGILAQEIVKPGVFFYNAGLPENLPNINFGGPDGKVNLGGILAWEFLLMHWVEVRRWQDIRKPGSVNEDPIFKGNKVPNPETGYPGGIFDPFGFSKGNFKELQTKEIKNARLAMVAFVGFIVAAQATGQGPLANLTAHLSNPFGNNITKNIGRCMIPSSVDVQGIRIPLTCLWPGQQMG